MTLRSLCIFSNKYRNEKIEKEFNHKKNKTM